MPLLSKDEMAKAEAALAAEELVIKKKWCQLKGHRWDLPSVSPFNHDIMECVIICNRCNVHATVKVIINSDQDQTNVKV